MSEFEGIEGVDGWSTKLTVLLKEAQATAQQVELDPRLAISNRLIEFMVNSSPNSPEILALDRIANEACKDLLRKTIEDRLQSLGSRQADVVALTKKVQVATEESQASAASIRLERTRKVIAGLTDSIQRLNEFKSVLREGADEKLSDSVAKLIASAQKLRSQIESIV
jgi:hypothetical protein